MLTQDFSDWTVVYQPAWRWLQAGVFPPIAHDLRVILRWLSRASQPSATTVDDCMLQSTPESGECAGFEGAKKKKGSKVHGVVDTMGNRLALTVTAANEQGRKHVAELATKVQEVTGRIVEIGFVAQG